MKNNPGCLNFLNKKDPCFKQLQRIRSADVFTEEDEQKLWNSGVLSLSTPKSLQNAVFYTLEKMFCLHGGVEHRTLKLSQLKQITDPDRYIYYETLPKITMDHSHSFMSKAKSYQCLLLPRQEIGF